MSIAMQQQRGAEEPSNDQPMQQASPIGTKAQQAIDEFAKQGYQIRVLPKPPLDRRLHWWEVNEVDAPIVNIGRKVYALYNGQYYDAVCRAIRRYITTGNQVARPFADPKQEQRERLHTFLYLVQFLYEPDEGILHYEWLNESELYPYEMKTKQIQRFLNAPKILGEPKKMSSLKKGGNKQKAKWTKKKKEPAEEEAFDSDNDSHLKIPIPTAVRKRLLEEWSMINTEKTVVPLPKKPNVHEILNFFFAEATSINEDPRDPLDITVNDFTRMFNIYIGLALLYRYERPQYEQVFNQRPKIPMAAIYGAEHLLRLSVKLPSLIVKFNESPALIPVVLELMMFLKDNMAAFFVEEYSETDDSYFIKLYS